jgi:hypothetical protein
MLEIILNYVYECLGEKSPGVPYLLKFNHLKSNGIKKSLKCKTNTLSILMHQMRISTNQVSSVVLRPKKLEIGNENV